MLVKVNPLFAIGNQQNRLITMEVMANRVYEEMTIWPPKKQIFEFLVNLASKVSISTNSDPVDYEFDNILLI